MISTVSGVTRRYFFPRLTRVALTTQIATGTTLVFLLFISIFGFVTLHSFKNNLYEVLVSDQNTLLSRVSEDLDNTILRLTHGLVESAKIVTKADIESADTAQKFLDLNSGLTTLFDRSTFLFTTEGNLIAEHPWLPDRRGTSFYHQPYIQKTIELLKPVMSEPFVTPRKDHHSVLVLAVPVLSSSGRLLAIEAGSLELTQPGMLSNIYTTVIGRTGYLFIVAKDGRIIMYPDKKRLLERLYPANQNPLFEAALKGGVQADITNDPNGRRSLISYKKIPSTDWVIGAVFPEDEAFGAYQELLKRFFILLAISGGAALISVMLFTRKMVWKLEVTNNKLEKMQTEATDKLQTRSRFFQEASHDFKQRLHAMQLLAYTATRSEAELPMLLQNIVCAVSNMKNYIAHFLEFTQLETSANQPVLTTVHFQDIFQKLEVEFEDIALQRKVDLKIRATPLSILTDEKMLLRILENLVSNSIKFARSRVLIGVRKSKDWISIEVWDNGPGIPKDQSSLVFEAFHQTNSKSGFHDGVGLGLAIVKRLAICLGYKICVDSSDGKFNRVKISIPVNLAIISNKISVDEFSEI